jgi:hypothetical protein
MKNFLLGFLIGLLFVFIAAGLLAYGALHAGERKVSIPDNAALVLHLEGDLPEQPPLEMPIPLLAQRQPPTMLEVWQMLRKAAVDSRIKALVLEPRGLEVGCMAPAPANITFPQRPTASTWLRKTSSI